MKKKFFYCGSTQALLFAIANNDYAIIGSSRTAEKLSKKYNRKFIEILPKINLESLVLNYANIKKDLKRITKIIEGGELHFSHTQFDVFCFILINYASKRNVPVYHHNFELVYNRIKYPKPSFKNIYKFILISIVRVLYKTRLIFKEMSGSIVPSIDSKFIKKHTVSIVNNKNTYFSDIISLYKSSPYKINKVNSLFISQDLYRNSMFDQIQIDEIYDFIKAQNIYIKYHPGSKQYTNSSNSLTKANIDHDIPVEFYFTSVKHAVISIYSSALITASYMPGIISISLLDIVDIADKNYYNKIKDYLTSTAKQKIYFPKSFTELQSLLN